jgi:hypothetical protein
MQHNNVAGIQIPLMNESVVPTMLKILILSRSWVVMVHATRPEFFGGALACPPGELTLSSLA